ncbi:transmembrane protein, putative (macronuclear) [Tetrahymena thermophila SB210]|uniref:Transmembrane protein, putative n=1 Tax=Tetrahymena thermophila (strain SB210) TaxID=312017 RepID=W7WWN6_TETTS|nr:transmembrane protein, putative [Tetrahymena thermophila SB210]EWS71225.1 transmembrane protein, putative [Tetrahymena thermophila SB210]|eukprot:XP_012656246.1 transmembrane protein, putative [Tetrahymena thermophila SB210]
MIHKYTIYIRLTQNTEFYSYLQIKNFLVAIGDFYINKKLLNFQFPQIKIDQQQQVHLMLISNKIENKKLSQFKIIRQNLSMNFIYLLVYFIISVYFWKYLFIYFHKHIKTNLRNKSSDKKQERIRKTILKKR